MTCITGLTPSLERLQLGPMTTTLPSASPWPAVNSWTTPPSWRSSSATKSTAAPNVASNSGSMAPVSRRPAGWSAIGGSTGRRQSPWTVGSWTLFSPWSFSTSIRLRLIGKSFLAQALGYSTIGAGHTVRFIHGADFFKAMAQARVDNSLDRTFRSFLTPDLLILDDLRLHRLTLK